MTNVVYSWTWGVALQHRDKRHWIKDSLMASDKFILFYSLQDETKRYMKVHGDTAYSELTIMDLWEKTHSVFVLGVM